MRRTRARILELIDPVVHRPGDEDGNIECKQSLPLVGILSNGKMPPGIGKHRCNLVGRGHDSSALRGRRRGGQHQPVIGGEKGLVPPGPPRAGGKDACEKQAGALDASRDLYDPTCIGEHQRPHRMVTRISYRGRAADRATDDDGDIQAELLDNSAKQLGITRRRRGLAVGA
jgi:hypothetical protein